MSNWKKPITYQHTGYSHASKLKDTQDSIRCEQTAACTVVAVADGVGSLPNSKYAADAATMGALMWFRNNCHRLDMRDIDHILRQEMIPWIREQIIRAVKQTTMELSSMDCNLAFVCILDSGTRAVYGSLGDCAVCVLGDKNQVLTTGVGLPNGTYTLFGPEPDVRIRLGSRDLVRDPVQGFMVLTDGLEDWLYRKDSSHLLKAAEDYFNASGTEELDRLVCALPARFDDDISIGILSRAESRIVLPDNPNWLCTCGRRNDVNSSVCGGCGKVCQSIYGDIAVDFVEYFRLLNKDKMMERRLLSLPTDDLELQESAVEEKPAPKPQVKYSTGKPVNLPEQRESGSAEPKRQEPKIEETKPVEPKKPIQHPGAQNSASTPLGNMQLLGFGDKKERSQSENPKKGKDDRRNGPQTGERSRETDGSGSGKKKRIPPILIGAAAGLLALVLLANQIMLYRMVAKLRAELDAIQGVETEAAEGILNETQPQIPLQFEGEGSVYVVSARVAYVVESPGSDHTIDILSNGKYVLITGEKTEFAGEDWVPVRTEADAEGWCRLSKITPVLD